MRTVCARRVQTRSRPRPWPPRTRPAGTGRSFTRVWPPRRAHSRPPRARSARPRSRSLPRSMPARPLPLACRACVGTTTRPCRSRFPRRLPRRLSRPRTGASWRRRAGRRRGGAARREARAAPAHWDGEGVPARERRVRAAAVQRGAGGPGHAGRARRGRVVLGDKEAAGAAHKCTFVLGSSTRCPALFCPAQLRRIAPARPGRIALLCPSCMQPRSLTYVRLFEFSRPSIFIPNLCDYMHLPRNL
jgi:hypothetical protein